MRGGAGNSYLRFLVRGTTLLRDFPFHLSGAFAFRERDEFVVRWTEGSNPLFSTAESVGDDLGGGSNDPLGEREGALCRLSPREGETCRFPTSPTPRLLPPVERCATGSVARRDGHN